MILNQAVTILPSVGPKLKNTLAKCHIACLGDLLFHLPYRYQDRTHITPIRDLRDQDYAVIEGTIIKQDIVFKRKKQLLCYLEDSSHVIKLRYFHFTPQLKEALQIGRQVRVFGQTRAFAKGKEIAHPEFESIDKAAKPMMAETLTPIYPTTENLSQKRIRQIVNLALDYVNQHQHDIELLPLAIREVFTLPPLIDCLNYLHNPPPDAPRILIEEQKHPYQLRMAFEELLAHHFANRKLRLEIDQHKAPLLEKKLTRQQSLLAQLPFKPTNAQTRVVNEINQDLIKKTPMYRLVQGDVGSGKTLVAALASLFVIDNHYQVALMAPTELLAEQLAKNISNWFTPLQVHVSFLTGKLTSKQKRLVYEEIKTGKTDIAIGTHALFQQDVAFHRLGLIIIDEQHRFGVKQRRSLQIKGIHHNTHPHQLIMTATPIPRTLAMTHYASLDISLIEERPPGRIEIKTAVIDNQKRERIIERLRHAFSQQKQAYWVCPLIEESETLQCENAEKTAEMLTSELHPHKVGLIHGRMKADEKKRMMDAFIDHQIDLLVATTVIEVGVDVPNASLMIIENAERLGLFQLHQLRGRVGRGTEESFCLLLYQSPLSSVAKSRLDIIRQSTSGFVIAEEDLKLRGYGDIIGTRQTGLLHMRIANLTAHSDLLNELPRAEKLLRQHHEDVIEKLIKRWLGDKEKYASN